MKIAAVAGLIVKVVQISIRLVPVGMIFSRNYSIFPFLVSTVGLSESFFLPFFSFFFLVQPAKNERFCPGSGTQLGGEEQINESAIFIFYFVRASHFRFRFRQLEKERERERGKGMEEEESSNLYEKIHIEVFVCAPYKNVYLSTPRVSVGPRDDQRGIIISKLTPG